ncbi:hydroxyacid dehydrogenase [Salinadaptatus halalkaliphilus]|uniref:Hydroxyacid dehydrogenase n=1 Tax=Salinadaptatus halalkaliphilus TaxID=2419781 RepID=A0A4S3TNV3_9EURY|nr:hydroxyacid dehydrogenase [Salinadaptatus halalkaliphilus]THE65982.1 hydroxyacid dehydrogenase [Salinadaptatus halalkaliphilus]
MSPSNWEVLLPAEIDPAGPELLSEFASTRRIDEYADRDALLADVQRFDAIITRIDRIDEALIDAASSLEIISKHGVGVDNIDIEAATERGVLVANTPGVNARGVAEHAITLLLAVRRRLLAANATTRAGAGDIHDTVTDEVRDDTIGLYGCGNIGLEVATLAHGLGMECLTYDPYVDAEGLPAYVTGVDTREMLFDRADVVSVHTPLTPDTRHAIADEELARLSPSGIVINTARADVVETTALARALEADELAGAGLDVFASEPPADTHPLFGFENVVATPHVGAQTTEALRAASVESANNVRTVYEGGTPETTINAHVC